MKIQQENNSESSSKTIYQLVKLISTNALPSALRNNSFIVNEVPASYVIVADENILATVLSRLLYTLINNAENGCIRISAKEYDDIVFVYLKSNRGLDNDAIDTDLQHAQSYARKMNGNVGLSKEAEKINGIVFSFPNMHFSKKNGIPGSENRTEFVSSQL